MKLHENQLTVLNSKWGRKHQRYVISLPVFLAALINIVGNVFVTHPSIVKVKVKQSHYRP
jgi:hypothetical protein